jgi:MFS family permease
VFLCGLAPVAVALLVRFFVRESETWLASAAVHGAPRIRELWSHEVRRATVAAIVVSITCLITWWAINAFIPVLGSLLAAEHARMLGLADEEARALSEAWKSRASNAFNLGGLLGGFAAIPLAKWLGRRTMFVTYYIAGGVAILAAFGLDLSAEIRLQLLFVVGAAVYGVFSAHVFYLPELFPTRLRALGSGFTYNIGRVVAALGPSVVGIVAARAGGSPDILMQALLWVAVIPFVAAATARILIVETRGRELPR